jgi:hypothetical protein
MPTKATWSLGNALQPVGPIHRQQPRPVQTQTSPPAWPADGGHHHHHQDSAQNAAPIVVRRVAAALGVLLLTPLPLTSDSHHAMVPDNSTPPARWTICPTLFLQARGRADPPPPPPRTPQFFPWPPFWGGGGGGGLLRSSSASWLVHTLCKVVSRTPIDCYTIGGKLAKYIIENKRTTHQTKLNATITPSRSKNIKHQKTNCKCGAYDL